MLRRTTIDEELVENHGDEDTILPSLLSPYEGHHPTRYDAVVRVQKEKNQFNEHVNSDHTGNTDDDGNERESADAICSREQNSVSADENVSRQEYLNLDVSGAMSNK